MITVLFTQNTSESRPSGGHWKRGGWYLKMSHGARAMTQTDFHELDSIFQDILSGLSYAGIKQTARTIGATVRSVQQKRIRAQQAPDGSRWPARQKRQARLQAGVVFIWKDGQIRRLKNWRTSSGRFGPMITGYDTERGGIRSFYKADIEDYLEINTRRHTARTHRRPPMFEKLRTNRFLKIKTDATGVNIGFEGRAARIARVHQFGEVSLVSADNAVRYPQRELLGLNEADKQKVAEIIINNLWRNAR
ncbi:phage virion morphogenesis protein [Escherichia coli]|nr:phage virion morphogenesis protein [Escherichia coli]EEX1986373.1 phage virion morphogenesis protein [Escherichia coli]EEZ5174399.1 phage virion morphogenesis protein [Escherichia coli]EFA7784041.1 phage virion morphogenesis protein [Escherichia coli]EFA7794596.1 phage virion morphogenesis protein [Escherichia coli]